MPPPKPWSWTGFGKAIGGGIVAGVAFEAASGGVTAGAVVVGGAASGAAVYVFDWWWGNVFDDEA